MLEAYKPLILWMVIGAGVAAISTASILIRYAEAPALVIACYRVAVAALLLSPVMARKRRIASKPARNGKILGTALLGGTFLAFHFGFWIQSLKMTTVASSVTLVSTTPLFVALFSRIGFKERFHRSLFFGVLCSTVGGIWVAGSDFDIAGEAFWGDLLALGGALMAAGYLVVGRSARLAMDVTTYAFLVYSASALILLILCATLGLPLWEYSLRTYVILFLLALIPQLIGHTSFNWALRFLPPTTVAVLLMGEPIGASLLAYLVFSESISPPKSVGLALLGVGIVMSSLGTSRGSPRTDSGPQEQKRDE
jgi:drug/metabolite transporter (DMT)-like permease